MVGRMTSDYVAARPETWRLTTLSRSSVGADAALRQTLEVRGRTRMRFLIRSKIHKATVTNTDVTYIGSIAIDRDLIDRADLWLGEKVLVVSNTSGARLETYVIEAPAGSGTVEMRGAAAHLIHPGEEIVIMGFEMSDRPIEPTLVFRQGANVYSHSMVAGGLELISYVTRFTPFTSLMMRVEMRASTSCGNGYQSAVMPSLDVTARSARTFSYVRASPMTPTERTGSNTAKACQISSYRPAALISSR